MNCAPYYVRSACHAHGALLAWLYGALSLLSRMHWRCKGSGAVCYDGVGVFNAVVIEHAMGAVLERLTREGRKHRGDFGPPEGWEG